MQTKKPFKLVFTVQAFDKAHAEMYATVIEHQNKELVLENITEYMKPRVGMHSDYDVGFLHVDMPVHDKLYKLKQLVSKNQQVLNHPAVRRWLDEHPVYADILCGTKRKETDDKTADAVIDDYFDGIFSDTEYDFLQSNLGLKAKAKRLIEIGKEKNVSASKDHVVSRWLRNTAAGKIPNHLILDVEKAFNIPVSRSATTGRAVRRVTWTPSRLDTLWLMAQDGKSVTAISKEIGCTENAARHMLMLLEHRNDIPYLETRVGPVVIDWVKDLNKSIANS